MLNTRRCRGFGLSPLSRITRRCRGFGLLPLSRINRRCRGFLSPFALPRFPGPRYPAEMGACVPSRGPLGPGPGQRRPGFGPFGCLGSGRRCRGSGPRGRRRAAVLRGLRGRCKTKKECGGAGGPRAPRPLSLPLPLRGKAAGPEGPLAYRRRAAARSSPATAPPGVPALRRRGAAAPLKGLASPRVARSWGRSPLSAGGPVALSVSAQVVQVAGCFGGRPCQSPPVPCARGRPAPGPPQSRRANIVVGPLGLFMARLRGP